MEEETSRPEPLKQVSSQIQSQSPTTEPIYEYPDPQIQDELDGYFRHRLETIPSETSSLATSYQDIDSHIIGNENSDQNKPSSTSAASRSRSRSTIMRNSQVYHGSRHLSLMRAEHATAEETEPNDRLYRQNQGVRFNAQDLPRQSLERPLSFHSADEANRRMRTKSEPGTRPQFQNLDSDMSPIPPIPARLASFVRQSSVRGQRRPSISETGAVLFGGITDALPHAGVMAAAFSSIAVAPTPQEVVQYTQVVDANKGKSDSLSNSSLPPSVAPSPLPEQIQISRKHLKVLLTSYVRLFWSFFTTLKGFLVVIYLLNVIAWGGMLFLILVGAAPAMNHPDGPNGTDNAGKRWIEIDSQILNALFCVTGFGLMPQRTKHLIYLVYGQIKGTEATDKKLVRRYPWYKPGRNWYALASVLYLYELNSVSQVFMAAGMWAFNRHQRPPWLTGTCMGVGFGSSIVAGIIGGIQSRKLGKEAEQSPSSSANDLGNNDDVDIELGLETKQNADSSTRVSTED
ncbi:uncharacterized protein V1516DRAFT_671028 [Lipomyces oligophaga]|uniref:uncharacterized protein n=1 Tax=Lipomyces oligophaga TaxID=45792 RepID=UPI0034CFD0C9